MFCKNCWKVFKRFFKDEDGWTKKGIFAIVAFVLGWVMFIIAWFLWLKPLDITTASGGNSPPQLIAAHNVSDFDAIVGVEKSFELGNITNIIYTLTIGSVTYPANAPSPIDLHFVGNASLVDDPFNTTESTIMVSNVNSVDFPYRLPSNYDPDLFNDFIFTDAKKAIIGRIDADLLKDFGVSMKLVAQMSGKSSYTVGGTITVDNRINIVDGVFIETSFLVFKNIRVPSAPGPYLYLSNDGSWDGNDMFIPIEGTGSGKTRGSFTQRGDFTQDLDMTINLQAFTEGSLIVWCRPFSIELGSGEFTAEK